MLGVVTALAVIVVTSFAVRGVAGALPQSFSVSPASGPPGTVVEVSGTGCSPGITVSPTQDYVKVSSTILGLSTDIPVAANGSWHGSFTVPGNAIGAGVVLAVCFTDALPSLTTTYTPQGFIVTGNPPPTTTTTPTTTPTTPTTPTTARQTTITSIPKSGTTAPGGTPTTPPTNGSTPGSSVGGTPGGGTPGGGNPGSGSPGSGATGSTGGTSGGSTSGVTAKPAGSKAGATASEAGLRDPRLASSTSGHGDRDSLWVLWLLLIALAAGALALLWWWQHREPGEADPASDMT